MKAPKFVVFIDHFAKENYLDRYVESDCSSLLDLFSCISNVPFSESVYLIRVYQLVRGSRGREYERICNIRTPDNIFSVEKYFGLPDIIRRNTLNNYTWFD